MFKIPRSFFGWIYLIFYSQVTTPFQFCNEQEEGKWHVYVRWAHFLFDSVVCFTWLRFLCLAFSSLFGRTFFTLDGGKTSCWLF